MILLVGTERGLFRVTDDKTVEPVVSDSAARSVTGDWAVLDDRVVHLASKVSATFEGVVPYCLAGLPDGDALVGTSRARLFRVSRATGAATPVESFDAIDGRDSWYTPWGEPPDTRSLAVLPDGGVLVNVHVGGVWRADATLQSWREVVEVEDDTHQVVAAAGGVVVAAAAVGVGESDDGGVTFDWSDRGLHGSYCRAAAVAGRTILVSASTGPFTTEGAVYRREVGDVAAPFGRLGPAAGLPERFDGNVDTGQLAASGDVAALGTDDGRLFLSTDGGARWRLVADDLPPVRSVVLASA